MVAVVAVGVAVVGVSNVLEARATKCYIPATDLVSYPAGRTVPTRPSAIAPHSPMEAKAWDRDSAAKRGTWLPPYRFRHHSRFGQISTRCF